MNKIIAAILSLSMLATPALAWEVGLEGFADDASALIWGSGGAVGPGECCVGCCPEDCGTTVDYDLSGGAGIMNGNGILWTYGSGEPGYGFMLTEVDAGGQLVSAGQELAAEVCQDCYDFELYEAESSVTVENGGTNTYLEQGTGVVGPFTGFNPTTGQTLYTEGDANGDVDAHMTATKTSDEGQETHTMGMYGTNIAWYVDVAFQGMDTETSSMYGFFAGVMGYNACEDGECGDFCWNC